MQNKKSLILLWAAFFLICTASAEEGMWMPHQMKHIQLRTLGLRMNPDDLYKKDGTGLMSAVVHLGGGSGEFVSREGLILTNHHVAFGALQRASTKEKDYIQTGFIAWERNEEIPAKGYIADVLLGYEEVTDEILSKIKPSLTYREKYEVIEKATKKLIAREEKKGKDLRCQVASMYSGNEYYLFKFKRIKDIRIVYAPPRELGNFGGDIDNWMWPRHTCDFTFLRAYVSKDNIGVDYSPDNVPYRPRAILKISTEGFKEGDFSFIMGYPGRTYRNYTLSELQFDIHTMLKRLEDFKNIIDFYEKVSEGKREIQIKYASKIQGLNNALKNYQAKIEGMKKFALVEKKKDREEKFREWVRQASEREKEYGDIMEKIEVFTKKYANHYWKTRLLENIVSSYFGSALLSQAYLVSRTVEERQKPDMEREPSYQEREIPYIKMRIQLAERGYDLETDRAFLKHWLAKLLEHPEDQIPQALRELIGKRSEKAINDFVDALYEKTLVTDARKREEMIELKPPELMKIDDPILNFAAELEKEMKVLREESKALSQERLDLKKVYVAGLRKLEQGRIAPDANSTIRFTYGFIRGYCPRDAVSYLPQTTLKGVIEKDTGEYPFHVPEKLKQLFLKKDFGSYQDQNLSDIPACFLNTASVTGGNSGSPTLNAKGEQTGIVFDMTYESVISDYHIIPELQRTISVDIRYVLFITEKFSEAKFILEEIGL